MACISSAVGLRKRPVSLSRTTVIAAAVVLVAWDVAAGSGAAPATGSCAFAQVADKASTIAGGARRTATGIRMTISSRMTTGKVARRVRRVCRSEPRRSRVPLPGCRRRRRFVDRDDSPTR
jgi:hypothetical protein